MRLAINRLKERRPDAAAVDRFLARHEVPIVEGDRCTFLWRGDADAVHLVHRITGLPDRLPLRRIHGTDLWSVVLELPKGSRVNYQIEVRRGRARRERERPAQPEAVLQPGRHVVGVLRARLRDARMDRVRPGRPARHAHRHRGAQPGAAPRLPDVTLYLPARFRRSVAYPLLVVHDGGDFLQYAAAKTVLDNLVHRLDVAELVAAFVRPGDRLVEYADSPAHARFLTRELLPRLESELPLVGQRSGRCLLGSSFGAVAALSAAYRSPDTYGALALMSGSFVFTDIAGADHGGGPVFDPVVKFVNRYRARPRRVADRLFVSCGVFEPLITPNRSMVPTFEGAGMTVRFHETRDGHTWENWRDSLRDALAWIYPGPQKMVYE